MERRKGGESGVKAVTSLTGNDVWKAGDAGRWNSDGNFEDSCRI